MDINSRYYYEEKNNTVLTIILRSTEIDETEKQLPSLRHLRRRHIEKLHRKNNNTAIEKKENRKNLKEIVLLKYS